MVHGFILIISAVFPPEPVVSAKLSSDLYSALIEKGYFVKVLHPRPTRPNGFDFGKINKCGENEVITNSFVCPQMSRAGRMRESWSFGRACSNYIKEHRNDISCIYVNAWPMFSQKAIVKVAKKYKIPCLIHVQDVYPESLANKMSGLMKRMVYMMFLPMDKFILKNSDKVIAISKKMKEYLVMTRGIDEGKCSVVVNWQDETEFLDYEKQLKENSSGNGKFTFMYMGNIGPVAGVDLLIDAFNVASIENSRLVIAGSGSMKESLQEKAKNNQNIEFWDVPNGKVPEIQSKADVMMLPIKRGAASSSIPSKLPAYMFSAKPIIGAMDVNSDTANAIREANGGVIVESESKEALAQTMKEMAEKDSKSLDEMGLRGQKYALEHFSKSANLKNLTQVVCGMIK